MSRKSVVLALGIVVVLIGGGGTTLGLLVRHEPEFYRRAAIAPGKEREDLSKKCQGKLAPFITVFNPEEGWTTELSEQELNSYLVEDFIRSGASVNVLPEGVRDLRVSLEKDKVRFAFLYGEAPWSTIVSFDLNVWLPKSEPNVVALQLDGLRAGSVPIQAQTLLDRFSEALRRKDIEVNWYRYDGKPVALLRFQPGCKTPSVVLRNLKLEAGRVVIGIDVGTPRRDAPPPARAMTPETVRPAAN